MALSNLYRPERWRWAALATPALLLAVCVACGPAPPDAMPTAEDGGDEDFQRIFDGETLNGWEGDSTYWRVADSAMIGTITPETLLKRNSWILWRGGEVEDFELKLQYRISPEGNSGIGYRVIELEGEPWAVRGYQADIEGGDNWTGINYEERGRTFLAMRGQKTIVEPGKTPRLVELFAPREELQSVVRKEDWNDYHVIVRGGRMIHRLNGHLMSEVVDNDAELGQRRGLLGVQVHVGPPMTIEYRDILLKRLPPEPTPLDQNTAAAPAERYSGFNNPASMKDLLGQVKRLMTPPPEKPLGDQGELTVQSHLYLVRSDLVEGKEAQPASDSDARDLVLIDGDRVVRVPSAPAALKDLSWGETYAFQLAWQQPEKAYRVMSVKQGDNTVYEGGH